MTRGIGRQMDSFKRALGDLGLEATPQRLAIGEAAFTVRPHFTVEELFQRVRKREPRIGRVTVYRTLKVMMQARLVEERPFRKGGMLYEPMAGHRHHDHMLCLRCGKIIEFENERIEQEQARAAARHRFQILTHSHTLFGYCRNCRKSCCSTRGAGPGECGRNGRER
ncbi:MAG: transcriptional repressor [Planctomycetes bacterium]|nr:transcriptional repressor [Planctomycetota bacterium]